MKYLYDGDNVIVDYSAENKVIAQYVTPELDQYISMTRDGKTCYYTQDGLGSVRTLTDSSGNALNQSDYFAFGEGNVGLSKGSVVNRYGYTGREKTLDDGQMYYRWRMYEPQVGRFAWRDPIGYYDSPLIYGYVYFNPCLLVDPYGLDATHGISSCKKNPPKCCPDAIERTVQWTNATFVRAAELISDKYDMKNTSPKGYNDHIDQMVQSGINALTCFEYVVKLCSNPPSPPKLPTPPDYVKPLAPQQPLHLTETPLVIIPWYTRALTTASEIVKVASNAIPIIMIDPSVIDPIRFTPVRPARVIY